MRGERLHPLTPDEQVRRWLAEGETLQTLHRKIRTPEIRVEIDKQLAQQAKEARAPKPVVNPIIASGG